MEIYLNQYWSYSSETFTMGKKQDLTYSEKDENVRLLGKGISTLQIAKDVKRHHRTIKSFANNFTTVRINGKGEFAKLKKRVAKSLLARKLKQIPLSTSGKLFCEAGIQNCGRTLRCKILSTIGKKVQPIRQPPLSEVPWSKHVAWAKQYMKLDFRRVIFTDECRAALHGPDGFRRGWLHTATEIPRRLRR